MALQYSNGFKLGLICYTNQNIGTSIIQIITKTWGKFWKENFFDFKIECNDNSNFFFRSEFKAGFFQKQITFKNKKL